MSIHPEVSQRDLRLRSREIMDAVEGGQAFSVTRDDPEARAERGRRADVLQRAENEFDPLPFDAEAARLFGRLSAAVPAQGCAPRRRIADLMIAAVAAAADLPLYTTNPDDFAGLDEIVRVRAVRRPLQ